MGQALGIDLTARQKRTMGAESPGSLITDPEMFLKAFGDQPELFDKAKEYLSHADDV